MEEKLIISNVLTDLTLASKTKFIEAKDNEDLIKLAKTKGIDLPSPDLACFETYYCELDKPNLNNAMLTKKAAEEGINTLIGKQINLNHQGKNYVIGYTIDAKIKDNLIVTTGILFKSLFPDEFDEIKELFEEGKLFVSFELWNRQPETGESIIEVMEDGIKKITKMIAHGVGLLLKGVNPACRKAQVFKLLANQKDNGEQIFQEDDRFAFASLTNEVVECKHCTTCLCKHEKEVKIVDEIKIEEILENDYEDVEFEDSKKLTTEQRNDLPDSDFALIQEKEGKKIRRFPINDEAHVRNALARLPQAKDITEEEKKTALENILKKAKEFNMDELVKKYENSSEERLCPECKKELNEEEIDLCAECKKKKEEAKSTEIISEETKTTEVPVVAETKVEEIKVEEIKEDAQTITTTKEIVTVDEQKPNEEIVTIITKTEEIVNNDEGKEVVKLEEEVKTIVTYTFEQVQDEIKVAVENKDREIADLKTSNEQLDKEIKKLQDELGKKDQEIAELKTPKVESKEETLTVGAVDSKTQYTNIQKEIDKKAFSTNKKE